MSGSGADEEQGELTDTAKQIVELLDTRIRPAVARDGGDIVFQKFEKGIVWLKMRGACAGCPSSTMTLKNGIENMLRNFVPEVLEVRAINDE
jgi:Fe-S cluster biogenesis protein NfuA